MQFKKYSTISGKIDRNHEHQLRNVGKKILLFSIRVEIAVTEKKLHVFQ